MTEPQRKRVSWILTIVFVFALIMGPGPGMLLINSPLSFLGLPQLYVWGLLWYVVEVVVVVLAYLLVWSPRTSERERAEADDNKSPADRKPLDASKTSTDAGP